MELSPVEIRGSPSRSWMISTCRRWGPPSSLPAETSGRQGCKGGGRGWSPRWRKWVLESGRLAASSQQWKKVENVIPPSLVMSPLLPPCPAHMSPGLSVNLCFEQADLSGSFSKHEVSTICFKPGGGGICLNSSIPGQQSWEFKSSLSYVVKVCLNTKQVSMQKKKM